MIKNESLLATLLPKTGSAQIRAVRFGSQLLFERGLYVYGPAGNTGGLYGTQALFLVHTICYSSSIKRRERYVNGWI